MSTLLLQVHPANTNATIELKGFANATYEIYRADGVLIDHGRISGTTNQLDVSQWPEGIYLLRAFDRERSVFRRLIVVH